MLEDNTSGCQCWHRRARNDSSVISLVSFPSLVKVSNLLYLVNSRVSIEYTQLTGENIGWLTIIAWISTLAVGSVYTGSMIQGLLILNYPEYVPKAYQSALLTWAVLSICVFINTVVSKWLPKFEGFILIFHILGFFTVLITMLYLSPHGSAASVFKTSLNEGGWPTQGLSYCVGFIGNVATFVGRLPHCVPFQTLADLIYQELMHPFM